MKIDSASLRSKLGSERSERRDYKNWINKNYTEQGR